jgi:flagellar basal-body rod protein FlgB
MTPLDPQTGLLARLMDAATTRHRVVSHNIANLNTPGYRRQEVQFEEQLARAMQAPGGDPEAAMNVSPVMKETQNIRERADGNTVDLDREAGELQRTALLFQTYTQILQARLGMIRRAMDGG